MATQIETVLDMDAGLDWITPPECQGQIVTRSYAWSHDLGPVMRVHDASDGSVRIFAADEQTTDRYDDRPEEFDPANVKPIGTWDVPVAQTRPREGEKDGSLELRTLSRDERDEAVRMRRFHKVAAEAAHSLGG